MEAIVNSAALLNFASNLEVRRFEAQDKCMKLHITVAIPDHALNNVNTAFVNRLTTVPMCMFG